MLDRTYVEVGREAYLSKPTQERRDTCRSQLPDAVVLHAGPSFSRDEGLGEASVQKGY